ncbi:NUDIX domain-containing protein [Clostridium frigidicarnis]|uniref:NUDIX domain-containing protein n=1 Tax=Clostridium frigidicarnis TaxID=84698 RepID=UPI000B7FFFBD|nr:NUDIX domain-containing protein [Clostridium frigidicarnis]
MSKLRARAIIPYEECILLIHRIREEQGAKLDYYVFPGGGVEDGENEEQCVIREVYEELGIDIKVCREIYRLRNNGEVEIFFLAEYIGGEIGTGNGAEFLCKDNGVYIPTIVPINKLKDIPLIDVVRDTLVSDLYRYKRFDCIKKREL